MPCLCQTIHPFLDGNGRIGRSLIGWQRVAGGLLREPLPHPSLFFMMQDERLEHSRWLAGD